MAVASIRSHLALTQLTVIGDCVGWRSEQTGLVQTSLAAATQAEVRRSRFVCQLDSPTHDLADSDDSSQGGAQPNLVKRNTGKISPRVRLALGLDFFKDHLQFVLGFGRQPFELRVADELHHFLCVDHRDFDLLAFLPHGDVAR